MKEEIWRGLIYGGKDYSEWLEVSNLGRIRNPKTGTIRKQNLLHTGYYFVSFSMGSRENKKTIRVHKAIAEVFIPNPENKPFINHIDGNKTNNSLDNLEWTTESENVKHAIENGLITFKSGYNHPLSGLTKDQIEYAINNYIPRHKEFGIRAMARKFNISRSSLIDHIKHYKENLS